MGTSDPLARMCIPVWETSKNLLAGETYEHTIEKSELYRGQLMTYYASFDKCDRVEDYKVAWAHFEEVLIFVKIQNFDKDFKKICIFCRNYCLNVRQITNNKTII